MGKREALSVIGYSLMGIRSRESLSVIGCYLSRREERETLKAKTKQDELGAETEINLVFAGSRLTWNFYA
jgi:hypothetical protein